MSQSEDRFEDSSKRIDKSVSTFVEVAILLPPGTVCNDSFVMNIIQCINILKHGMTFLFVNPAVSCAICSPH